jgi:protein ImuB
MPPIACLLVSDFPLAALLRANPELRDGPAASSEGRGPHAHLSFVAPLARRAGVIPGMTVAQASAIAPDLIVMPRSSACERAAADALADAAESISPIVEEAGDGRIYVELGRWGGGAAPSSEPVDYRETAAEIARRVRAVGMEAAVGIASSKELAWIAARCGGVRIIESGQEAEFLNWVPLDLLGLEPELEATLARWGIRRLGEMARLDSREVGSRLGAAGADLVRLARGDLERNRKPLTIRARAEEFVEKTELEYGIEQLEQMSFVMRGILERLTARLKLRGLVAGDMQLALELADRRRDERHVAVAAATVEVRSLLALLILSLEKSPSGAAVEGIRIAVHPRTPRPMQNDMFLPPAPAPDRLQTTLARLAALCGPEHVGALHPQNSHRPEAVELKRFAPPPAAPQSAAQAPGVVNRLMVRTIRPAQEVEVMCARGHPDFVRGRNLCARVVSIAGPWRRQGEWWRWQSGADGRGGMGTHHDMARAESPWADASARDGGSRPAGREPPFARDYYDLALADGGVYRIYHDLHNQKWFVDGVYD